MSGRLLYLIGPPGSGKTTAMTAATSGWQATNMPGPCPYVLLLDDGVVAAVELGARRPGHGGTDAMSMSVGPAARAFVESRPHPLVLGEGQRLATRPFLCAAAGAGYTVLVCYLAASPRLTAERCAARGTSQDGAWARGAATRARNLAAWCAESGAASVVVLDAEAPAAMVAERLRSLIVGPW